MLRFAVCIIVFLSYINVFSQQNIIVDCSDGPISTTFCYDTGLDNSFVITSNDGSAINLSINEGQVETGWDEFIILDSDATELYNGYGNGGDISGLSFQSSGDSLTLIVDEDGSISCVSSNYTPITFTVACATCVNPQVNFDVVSDCLNAPQFFVDVNITDLGDASSLSIFDNQGNNSNAGATGIYQLGPYPNNTDVQITVQHNNDTNCSVNSGSLTQEYCATTLVDCAVGPVSSSYCYGNGDTTQFEYVSSDGSPLNLTIDSGLIEAGWDIIIVSDSDGTVLFQGDNGGDLTGLNFQSSGDSIFLGFQTDGSVSCQSSSTYAGGIDWTVACATCTNPTAEYTVIDDCENGEQFLIDVNITSLGDASSLTISDNYSTVTEQVSTTGIVQMGPYPFLTDIVITVSNDQDVNCVINSNPIQLFACPPPNDNCSGAITIEANADETCSSFASGTLVAATASSESNSCAGFADDDVWFEFTAVSQNHAISLYNLSLIHI